MARVLVLYANFYLDSRNYPRGIGIAALSRVAAPPADGQTLFLFTAARFLFCFFGVVRAARPAVSPEFVGISRDAVQIPDYAGVKLFSGDVFLRFGTNREAVLRLRRFGESQIHR